MSTLRLKPWHATSPSGWRAKRAGVEVAQLGGVAHDDEVHSLRDAYRPEGCASRRPDEEGVGQVAGGELEGMTVSYTHLRAHETSAHL
eukprot:7192820-Alexandrium_andersonii.AAC.1